MTVINFQCKKCRQVFDCNVGDVTFPPEDLNPKFQKDVQCPNCGRLSMGKFELTELGQSQLTDLFVSVGRTAAPHKNKKIARNDACPCGSGKKYKKCCWLKVH